MNAKYSLIYLTTGNCSPAEMLYLAVSAGYDSISPRTIPMGLPGERVHDLAGNKTLFNETRDAIKNTGISIDTIENARIYDGVDIRSYEPALQAAAELGAKHILSNIWSKDSVYYTEKFIELCELAAVYGQRIELEFVTWATVSDLQISKELLLACKCENAGIIIDTLHFYRSKVKLEELDTIPEKWLYCVHLCDAPEEIPEDPESLAYTAREARLFPGEGYTPIKQIISKVPNAVRGIEIPHLERMKHDGVEVHTKNAINITKEYLGAL